MVSFDRFQPVDGIPIYQQILTYIKREAAAGNIQSGDELPSRRVLSALLGINPNTVQKAFRLLEEEGLIESRSGAKSYMTLQDDMNLLLKKQMLREDIQGIVKSLKQMNMTKKEALELIERYWEE